MTVRSRWLAPLAAVAAAAACGGNPRPAAPPPAAPVPTPVPAQADRSTVARRDPALPPQLAMLAGLMPLRSLGVDTFRVAHPTFDGRGVIIGILDSGIDAGVPGLRQTSTGERKILDLRDFSGEGRIPVAPIHADPDGSVVVSGQRLGGFGRVTRLAAPPYWGGVLRERDLGSGPGADVNGNGAVGDELPVVLAKSTAGWFVVADTDGNASLEDERPVHDYLVAGETFTFRAGPDGADGPMTVAVNASEGERVPLLDLFMDNSSHGTHVSGIAAGHDLFGVEGFDGVAPGAWLLGLKISNNARGGISVTGSMLRAMNYAADFAARRRLPLILNLSFGVGNEIEGAAAIDSLIDEFALKHPDVLFVISAGNDGPGISTLGFPGSAAHALTVCALFPGVFMRPPQPGVPPPGDVLGWWSGRGGEVSKPDVCGPGVAFSNVPAWRTGEEVSGGTSMAAPHVSGAAAVLLSAMSQHGRRVRAVDVKGALTATAAPIPSATVLDAGSGVPNVAPAYRWLLASHQTGVYDVRPLQGGVMATGTAAYRRRGLASPADTLQQFLVHSVGGQPAARLLLRSDAPWIRTPPVLELRGRPEVVALRYDARQLREPGLYVGSVWAVPSTDTMAGPSFAMTSTVIVPHTLDDPVRVSGRVDHGQVARYYLDVPAGSGGLDVSVRLSTAGSEATLYLFEPSGQPFRGGSSVGVGGVAAREATMRVTAEDLVPGVYEAVVVAPPAGEAEFTLEAALPAVHVAGIAPAGTVVLRNESGRTQTATISSRLIGAVRTTPVRGAGAEPSTVTVAVPDWAARMILDVTLEPTLWHALTDFGVTVFDSSGAKLSDGPLNYAFGRQTVALEASETGRPLTIELFPGFAHFEPPREWSATLRVVFETHEPVALRADTLATSAELTVTIPPGAEVERIIPTPPAAFAVPPGFAPLVELHAAAPDGPPAVRRGSIGTP